MLRISTKSRWLVVDFLCLALLMSAGCGDSAKVPPDPSQAASTPTAEGQRDSNRDLVVAAQALQRNDLEAAEAAVRNRLLKVPDDGQALELAGDIAARRQQTARAIEMYRSVVDQSSSPSESLLDKLAQQFMVAGLAYDSVDVLRQRVDLYPESLQARYDFVGLATVLGLSDTVVPSLQWLCQHGHGSEEFWQVLADPRRVEPDAELCQKLLQLNDNDLRAEFGLAQLEAKNLEWDQVRARLAPVLKKHTDFAPAFTLYGRALAEMNDFDAVVQWQETVPASVASSPEYWMIAGQLAEHQGKDQEAARAYWEAIRLDPAGYPEILTKLSSHLSRLGRTQDVAKVSSAVTKQAALRDAIKTHFERSAQSQQAAIAVADAMTALGRTWEAEGWARLAVSLPNDRLADIRKRYLAIRSELKSVDTPWQVADMIVANQIDLSDLPKIDWVVSRTGNNASELRPAGKLLFQDQAKQRGWVHTCEVAPETATEGHWIYQSVGGGVGVIDFDLDGWPDLAAAMLDGKPLQVESSPNGLFRNLQGQFVACNAQANYIDRGFAQGITVGDFNDDGFPDIFDANIGGNRLFQNNGDGTFRDVSSAAGFAGQAWTTSAVIADINGDGFADVYEVNYCAGPEPYEVACRNKRGMGTCPPLKFNPEQDRVWRGAGDATFVDATAQWMQQTTPGRGLGVVAGLIDERPGLDLYIANDMTVNHLWSANTNDDGFQLLDLGAIRGLGLSGRSLSQASMGMAVGDPDGDGDLDFFLTHFSDDHNTYYTQVAPGHWVDQTYQVGLSKPSMDLLGFGTEWVDFDNNGTLELIVANGHVDEVDNKLYRMPAQLFQRAGDGRYVELKRQELGPYFAENHLGRALAVVDVDRDGRNDVAITHLYQPVSLLINQTAEAGQAVALELRSTRGQRDAIGTIVTMKVDGKTIGAQLTAGDGYMCTNQRRISVGVGDAGEVTDVVVTWPSGKQDNLGTLPAGADYLVVEGSSEAYLLQSH